MALRVAVPVGIFAYALQVRRLLDFMPVETRPAHEPYLADQLRRLTRLKWGWCSSAAGS